MAQDEVLFEFQQAGAYVKVTAVDAASGREVSIVGDANAGRDHLIALALRKLERQSASPRSGPETPDAAAPAPTRRGILI